jgi:hypothetical protein
MSSSDKRGLHIHYPLVAVNSQGQKNWKMMVQSDLQEATAELCENGSSGPAIADVK